MVTVLVVPDGAADPLGAGPTCLQAAPTPALDRLAREGQLLRVATIPGGLAPGTEVGLASLLGADLDAPLPRGLVEAAAAGVGLAPGEAAWRLDRRVGETADAAGMDAAVRPLGGRVHPLEDHRALLVGPACWGAAPPGPHQTDRPLEDLASGAFATIARLTGAWPWGGLPTREPADVPTVLGRPVTVVAAGAPAGIARLLGCQVTGAPAESAIADAGADEVVVVHCPGPDDAAHARDRAAKIAALEAVDALTGRLAAVVARRGGELIVCPDHGCDPATGRHTADPVPALHWLATEAAAQPRGTLEGGWARGPGGASGSRLTEQAVMALEPVAARVLLAGREVLA